MTDTLEIFGKEYTGVTGIIAKDDNLNDKTYIRPQGTKSISQNGNNIDVAEYESVNVSVSPTLQAKTKSYTPSENSQSETVTAGSGYDGLSEVQISVGAISTTYVGSGIARKSSSDLTANGATVTAPAGYYESSASKSVSSGTATTPTTTVTANPSISVSESGLITATASATKSVTPTVSAGWVSSGTAGTITVSGSNTSQLTTQGAQTITPTDTAQTIASGKYLTGAQTIEGIVCENLTASNIKDGVVVKIGTATDDDSVTTVTGTFVGGGVTQDAEGFLVVPTEGGGGGGSGEPVSQKQITFIDYDGTLLHSYTSTEWANVTALPPNPSHSGLTSQGWNWTKAQIDAQLTAMPTGDVIVGQNYVTQSGDTEIDVELVDSLTLSPYISLYVNGEITIDWGDNSTADTVIGTSLSSSRKDTQHTYVATGSYTIKIHVVSGSFAIYPNGSTYLLLNAGYTSNNSGNRAYSRCIKNVRLGNNVAIKSYAFAYCYGMRTITITNNITSVGDDAFCNCISLLSVTLPNGITTLGNYLFERCYATYISLPSSITSIGNYVFYYACGLRCLYIPNGCTSLGTYIFNGCSSLYRVVLPNGITSIPSNIFNGCHSLVSITTNATITSVGSSAFNNCYALAQCIIPSGATSIEASTYSSCYCITSATIPSTVTSIGGSAFRYCYSMKEVHVKPTAPPTLGTTVFGSLPSDCVIYVPTAKLSDYQAASGWSEWASYMQGE